MPSPRQPDFDDDAIQSLLDRQRERARTGSGSGNESAPGVHCPPQDSWPLFARALTPSPDGLAVLAHAAECAHCGPLLAAAVEARAAEDVAAALPSAQPRMQHRLAKHLARPKPGGPVPPLWPPRWAWALACAALLALGLGWWHRTRASAPAALLAQAYTQFRRLDFRIAGAAYAPLLARRGGDEQPAPALLEAEAALALGLEKSPADPSLLALRGRAEILDLHYGDAIRDLTAALGREPGDAGVLTDLASAYFERAQQTGRAADLEPALDDLGRALARSPRDPVALFNRALVEEQFPMPVQAAQDWSAYLQVDPSSAWANEARRHLAAVKKK